MEVHEPVDIVVWTAGIQPVEIVRKLPIDTNKSGRVIVNQYHQVPTYKNVYVVGDCAAFTTCAKCSISRSTGDQIADVLKTMES